MGAELLQYEMVYIGGCFTFTLLFQPLQLASQLLSLRSAG